MTTSLSLDIDGATDEELDRGLTAAWDIFVKANVHPNLVIAARGKREWWDINGFDEELAPTDEEMDLCDLWDDAKEAAIEATCANWPKKPTDAGLELIKSLADAD